MAALATSAADLDNMSETRDRTVLRTVRKKKISKRAQKQRGEHAQQPAAKNAAEEEQGCAGKKAKKKQGKQAEQLAVHEEVAPTVNEADKAAGNKDVQASDVPQDKNERQANMWEDAVAENGKWDMRGAVGQKWAKEIQDDLQLRADYDAVGKGYTAQRNFRHLWAKRKQLEQQQMFEATEGTTQSRDESGTLMSFLKIWEAEGKDEDGLQAAKEYVSSCIAKHKAGETLDGEPWIQKNDMTKRVDFVYVKKTVKNSFVKKKLQRTSWTANADEPPADDDPAKVAPRTPIAAAEAAAAKAKAARAGSAKPAPSPNGKAAKPGTKHTNAAAAVAYDYTELAKIRKNMKLTMSDAQALITTITTIKQWVWARNEHYLGKLTAAKQALETFRNRDAFWQAWTIEEKFQAYAEKNFQKNSIVGALNEAHEVAELVKKLQKTVAFINDSKALRAEHEQDDDNEA